MSPRRRVYLDVDGVINVLPWDALYTHVWGPALDPRGDHVGAPIAVPDVGTIAVRWSPSMRNALVAVVASADVACLTSWRQQTPTLVAPTLDLPDWPQLKYADGPNADSPGRRVHAVIDGLATQPRPFVWIDDVECAEPRRRAQNLGIARDELADRDLPPDLTIAPDPQAGLTPHQINQVAGFIAGHT